MSKPFFSRFRLIVILLLIASLLTGAFWVLQHHSLASIMLRVRAEVSPAAGAWGNATDRHTAASQPVDNPPSSNRPIAVRTAATGPLRVSSANQRYFEDPDGRIVYLTGSHTWSNLQDNGPATPPALPAAFNYNQYLNWLESYNHNFFRLWSWEQARWTLETSDDNYRFYPMPFKRTGPGLALDGLPKYDLTQFEQLYFDRLRERVVLAGSRGMYVAIVLFDGWSIEKNKGGFGANNPWKGHPFNPANNINGIDGDTNNNDSGEETHTLAIASVTDAQEEYVRKVIDTVNGLDNVLYEISNESPSNSLEWQTHMVDFIKTYEAGKPKQHPVGITVPWPNGWNPDLFETNADWISPNGGYGEYAGNPAAADGSKVVIVDSDHICGVCLDRVWVWKSFTRGLNPIYMDVYDGAGYGVGANGFNPNDPMYVGARQNMGYTLSYAHRMNLASMLPLPQQCSTGFCLARTTGNRAEFLVYAPSGGTFSVDMSKATGDFVSEWLNPSNGAQLAGGLVQGGATRNFTPPFSGDAVLYIHPSIGTFKTNLPLIMRHLPR